VHRKLVVVGVVTIVTAVFGGFLAIVLMPLGGLSLLLSLFFANRWFDELPSLRLVGWLDVISATLALGGAFVLSQWLLEVPALFWVQVVVFAALLSNAVVFARHRRRGAWVGAIFVLTLFVLPLVVARSSGLTNAVEERSAFQARLFLLAGADPHHVEQHEPLLIIALQAKDAEVVRLLLAHGADPNCRTRAFLASTPALSVAAATGDPALVDLLLDSGANPNAANSFGETPLARAARAGKLATARLLLTRGANANTLDHDGSRPVDVAAARGHAEIERLLREWR
jgi:hypothetical protein